MARVTIKDLAGKLNINPSTVSRALRDHPDVSPSMRENIKQLAEKMGYKPNHMAINLRRGSSHTIGLIIPEIAPFFFPSLIKAVEEATHARGYNLLVLHSNDSIDREIENAEICANMGVDGILVSLSRQSHDIEHFQELMAAGIPIVFFDKVIHNSLAHQVVMPGKEAAALAVSTLSRSVPFGSRIMGFFADTRLSITEDRMEGFKDALNQLNWPLEAVELVISDDPVAAKSAFLTAWQADHQPAAVFVMSDELLSGIIQGIYQENIRIPEDLFLVGISDGELPNYLPFSFPYVHTSGFDMGTTAAGLLFQLIRKLPIAAETHYMEIGLVNSR
ncbi:LacI family DNA-binding transcriptional regulator [Flavihumibacter sp. UBA7668]|uniref:LacI family DNA-binding transcriptional regulator n=1 Tax=Flavihumibacter sp. UBA7668 TaxID=1946542 RepID=UPI0025BDD305|nr:LacI family DNA-binding transcriptional regulator [Flavihumibacter sp. UBA7668]